MSPIFPPRALHRRHRCSGKHPPNHTGPHRGQIRATCGANQVVQASSSAGSPGIRARSSSWRQTGRSALWRSPAAAAGQRRECGNIPGATAVSDALRLVLRIQPRSAKNRRPLRAGQRPGPAHNPRTMKMAKRTQGLSRAASPLPAGRPGGRAACAAPLIAEFRR